MTTNQDQNKESDQLPLSERIKEFESQYKELNATLQKSRMQVITDERAVLYCLQQLMPLQNTYLGSIIQNLNKQLAVKDAVKDKLASIQEEELPEQEEPPKRTPTPRVRTRKNNIIASDDA